MRTSATQEEVLEFGAKAEIEKGNGGEGVTGVTAGCFARQTRSCSTRANSVPKSAAPPSKVEPHPTCDENCATSSENGSSRREHS